MAGGKINAAGCSSAQYFKRNNWCRGVTLADVRLDVGAGQNASGRLNKALPHETGITADHDTFFRFTGGLDRVSNSLDHGLNVIVGEILTQDSAPT